jgi:hypothetical protein
VAKTKRGPVTRRQPVRTRRTDESRGLGDFKDIPERLTKIEAALKKVLKATRLPRPPVTNRTRLLFPLVTNFAGFDTSFSVANTGQDSSGVVGRAGICTVHYFGRLPNANPPARTVESTNRPVAVGETITFVLSSGGGLGLQGNPNFQGYVEVVCDFPFGHGWAFLADGPIGQARFGTTIPALVLPNTRTNAGEESVGQ